MPAARVPSLVALVLAAGLFPSVARGEAIRTTVRSWVTPADGQTPFTPGPGVFVPEATFDLTPGGMQTLGSFGPSDAWITPPEVPPAEATLVRREHNFTYTVEVTDVASGQVGLISLNGNAFAEWVQRADGLVFQERLGVTLGSADALVLGGNRYRVDALAYPGEATEVRAKAGGVVAPDDVPLSGGADVVISATPAVPEPATLLSMVGGLGVIGVGAWRRKRGD